MDCLVLKATYIVSKKQDTILEYTYLIYKWSGNVKGIAIIQNIKMYIGNLDSTNTHYNIYNAYIFTTNLHLKFNLSLAVLYI